MPVEMEIQERGTFIKRMNAGEVPFFPWGWTADYPDAMYFLSQVWYGPSPYNRARWKNAEFDQLIDRAQGDGRRPGALQALPRGRAGAAHRLGHVPARRPHADRAPEAERPGRAPHALPVPAVQHRDAQLRARADSRTGRASPGRGGGREARPSDLRRCVGGGERRREVRAGYALRRALGLLPVLLDGGRPDVRRQPVRPRRPDHDAPQRPLGRRRARGAAPRRVRARPAALAPVRRVRRRHRPRRLRPLVPLREHAGDRRDRARAPGEPRSWPAARC